MIVMSLAACSASHAQPIIDPVETRAALFAHALRDYERQHFDAAFRALSGLADQGHAEAARIALLMSAHGPRLYGLRFAVDEPQRERWLQVALSGVGDRGLASMR
ncbi:MAG: hypothetical protein V4792_11235 [Pseudomonadota bacterium]